MDIKHLTPDYAVSEQILVEDVAALKEAGFAVVICNRPDHENPPELHMAMIRAAVEAAGMRFVENPIQGGGFGADAIALQKATLAETDGPVFAYCRSGTRSSFVWALSMARELPAEAILEAGASAGYDLSSLAPYL